MTFQTLHCNESPWDMRNCAETQYSKRQKFSTFMYSKGKVMDLIVIAVAMEKGEKSKDYCFSNQVLCMVENIKGFKNENGDKKSSKIMI